MREKPFTLLKKISYQAFQWFVLLWILYTESAIVDYFCRAERWQCDVSEHAFGRCLIAVFIFILTWGWFRPSKVSPAVSSQIIARELPWLPLLGNFASVFSTSVLLILIAFFCRYTFDNCLLPMAMIADNCGNYKLAENIFKFREVRMDRRVPFAAWRSSQIACEQYDMRLARNEAVGQVFGYESLEMANRLFYSASNLEHHTDWYSDRLCLWYTKALELYRRNNFANGEMRSLWGICLNSHKERNSECRASLFQAHKRLSYTGVCPPFWCLDLLSWDAGQHGLKEMAKDFAARSEQLSKFGKEQKSTKLVNEICYLLTLCIAISIPTGLFELWFRKLLLEWLYGKLEKRMTTCLERSDSLPVLSKMIDIDLCLGKLGSANQRSVALLKMVGYEVLCDSRDLKDKACRRFWFPHLSVARSFALICLFLFSMTY